MNDKASLSAEAPVRRRQRRYRPTYEIAAGAARIVRALGRRLATEDPEDLDALLVIERELEQAWNVAIAGLRGLGYTDAQIGRQLGVSKQAVQQRFPR